eukprot:gene15050-biopygen10931
MADARKRLIRPVPCVTWVVACRVTSLEYHGTRALRAPRGAKERVPTGRHVEPRNACPPGAAWSQGTRAHRAPRAANGTRALRAQKQTHKNHVRAYTRLTAFSKCKDSPYCSPLVSESQRVSSGRRVVPSNECPLGAAWCPDVVAGDVRLQVQQGDRQQPQQGARFVFGLMAPSALSKALSAFVFLGGIAPGVRGAAGAGAQQG